MTLILPKETLIFVTTNVMKVKKVPPLNHYVQTLWNKLYTLLKESIGEAPYFIKKTLLFHTKRVFLQSPPFPSILIRTLHETSPILYYKSLMLFGRSPISNQNKTSTPHTESLISVTTVFVEFKPVPPLNYEINHLSNFPIPYQKSPILTQKSPVFYHKKTAISPNETFTSVTTIVVGFNTVSALQYEYTQFKRTIYSQIKRVMYTAQKSSTIYQKNSLYCITTTSFLKLLILIQRDFYLRHYHCRLSVSKSFSSTIISYQKSPKSKEPYTLSKKSYVHCQKSPTTYQNSPLCCIITSCLLFFLMCGGGEVLRGGGLGSRPKKMYGERLGDGVEYHLMKPTPRR